MVSANKYKYKGFRIISTLLVAVFWIISSCNKPHNTRTVEPAFYYWKSVYNLPQDQQKKLDSLQVKTLYVKYFDVDWDDNQQRPLPKASLRISEAYKGKQAIIPCIFITNECIQKLNAGQESALSKNIVGLVSTINAGLELKNLEVQIDCDWTANTRTVYFDLLKNITSELKKDSSTSSAILSATIRLYQVKYLQKTGVPPVSRGMLMAYNMGNMRDPSSKNSILETSELKKYINYLSAYPLQLDVALPIFEWIVLFRNNAFAGLITQLDNAVFSEKITKKISDNRFQIISDTTIQEYSFKKGDLLRIEKCETSEILATAAAISEKLKITNLKLALFHLDSITLSKYSNHDLENFFRSLN